MTLHESLHAYQGFFDLLICGGIRATHKPLPSRAEGPARNDRDELLLEQLLGKYFIIHTCDGNVGEGIKCTMRLERRQAKLVQATDDQLTPAVILITHLNDKFMPVPNGFQGC